MSKATKTLGRRLRLGVIGGGPDSFIGAIHRSAATMHEEFEVVAGVFSSNPERSVEAGKAMGIARLMPTRMHCSKGKPLKLNLSTPLLS